jgi:Tfp pilus assembly protein PilF
LLIRQKENKVHHSPIKSAIVIVFIAAILSAHAYGVHQRNKVWNSNESLWYDVAQKSPNNGRGLMNYGLSQMQKGNYSVAKTYFEKALKLSPNYPLLHINLGILHSAINDPIGAEQYFKKAITIDLYIDQSYYYYGSFLYSQKRYDEAKLMLKNSIMANPAYKFPRLLLLMIYNETEDWDNLKALAEETLTYLPNDPQCLSYIDAAKNKKSKIDIALETATKNPTAENYLNLSLFYYNAGKYDQCIEACKKAIQLKPDYALAYNNMCSAYNALKIFDKAIEAGKKAVSLQPDFELAKNNLKFAISQKNNQVIFEK